jgi:hypothetical protein
LALVERYSRYIESPILRLKFLKTAMSLVPSNRPWYMRLPLLRLLPESALLAAELVKFLPPRSPLPLGVRFISTLYRIRLAIYAFGLACLVATCAGIGHMAFKVFSGVSGALKAKVSKRDPAPSGMELKAIADIGLRAGFPPERVWLAERGGGYEFYSNGARILTEFETDGPERRFYRFDLNRQEPVLMSRPVGIVYHLSEGDLLPFAGQYNRSLQMASRALLEYVRQKRLYNYVIDRFGRIYRIVRDEFAADHAGNSIWCNGQSFYINLSSSFIGICFEGKSSPFEQLGPDGINEAQIIAARMLTAVLRSKFDIEDSNCVTHGLVSVNPANQLMGYHTDWISGFPFEALGLSNKYDFELMAISKFGFGYDRQYVAAAGGRRWPGLERAESKLKEAAARANQSIEEERRLLQRDFQKFYRMQRELERSSSNDQVGLDK